MESVDELARIFKVLAVESRLRILCELRGRLVCVNALACRLGISPPATSQHLRVLRDAGAVVADRRGYHVHYRRNEETLSRWQEQIGGWLGGEAPSPEDPCLAAGERRATDREENAMKEEKDRKKPCEHPEELKGRKPGECSPEQIRKCHGEQAEHPCTEEEE